MDIEKRNSPLCERTACLKKNGSAALHTCFRNKTANTVLEKSYSLQSATRSLVISYTGNQLHIIVVIVVVVLSTAALGSGDYILLLW